MTVLPLVAASSNRFGVTVLAPFYSATLVSNSPPFTFKNWISIKSKSWHAGGESKFLGPTPPGVDVESLQLAVSNALPFDYGDSSSSRFLTSAMPSWLI